MYPAQPPASPDPGARPKRPDSLSIATELWIVVILGELIAFIGQYPSLRDSWDKQVAALPSNTPKEQLDALNSTAMVVTVVVIAAVALSLISGLVVWLARSGYGWARVLLSAMGIFVAVNLVFALFGHISPTWVMVPMILAGVAGLGATVLLMRPESDKYCRDMAAYRARPRHPVGPPTSMPPNPYTFGPGYPQGPTQWPYGGGQQDVSRGQPPAIHPAERPDQQQPNEGNQTRGES